MGNNLMKLAAIWLDYSVKLEHIDGKEWTTPRIISGDSIGLKDGEIVNIDEQDAEQVTVIDCYGDVYSSVLRMEVACNDGSTKVLNIKG